MSWHYYYKDDVLGITEVTDRVQEGWAENPGTQGLVMNAEEGTVGTSQIVLEDPDGDLVIHGHRLFYVTEDLTLGDVHAGQIYVGFTAEHEYSRREDKRLGLMRIVTVTLRDINTIFERRVGNGKDWDRDEETDVARVTWVEATNEGSLIDDTTYFSTASPTDMDAVDYRGQSFRQVFDDCAQQAKVNKNWFLWRKGTDHSLWYGPTGTTDFASTIKISNVNADVDGTTVFAPAQDSTLTRDPSRVYSGVFMNYAGTNNSGAHVYVQREQTKAAFAARDAVSDVPNVKSKTKAENRANRYLRSVKTEEDRIETAILVDRPQANALVAGHRVQVKFSHFPGYTDYVWCRVLHRTIREVTPDKLEIAVTLSPDEALADEPAAPPVYGILYMTKGPFGGIVYYASPGDLPPTGFELKPTVGLLEAVLDVSPPNASWPYTGWKVTGTGTIDITFFATVTGVPEGLPTITFTVLLNDVVVGSTAVVDGSLNTGLHYLGLSGKVEVAALAVVPNDIITANITASFPFAFFQTPSGTGQNGERLEITGGSLS